MEAMHQLIASKIKEARLLRKMTQQDLANRLGRTAAAISDIERGKSQVAAADLYQLANLLQEPIEYFYGFDKEDDINIMIASVRKMTPEARANQMPQISLFLQMQDIVNVLNATPEGEEQVETARKFYTLLVDYSQMMNGLVAQLNRARKDMESILGIENAG